MEGLALGDSRRTELPARLHASQHVNTKETARTSHFSLLKTDKDPQIKHAMQCADEVLELCTCNLQNHIHPCHSNTFNKNLN